jgi:FkbM family methyltransferase
MNLDAFKSLLVGTLLEQPAKRLRWLMEAPKRARNPELIDILTEGERVDQVIRRLVGESSNCIDVGCHVGSVLSLLVKLAPRGRHMAFEPVPWKARRIARKFPQVEVRQMAVGDTSGEAPFQIDRRKSGYSGFRAAPTSNAFEITVPCDRLDRVVSPERDVNFVKIDVEGAELLVLRGARELIKRDRPAIIFESAGSPLSMYGLTTSDLYGWFVEENDYELFTPRGFLENSEPLTLERYHRAHQFPFLAFNFVAVPRRAKPTE